jgi:hypothetical protein
MFWDAFLICLCPRVISEIIEIKSMSLNIYEDIEKSLIFYMCLNYVDRTPKDCTSGLVISGGDICLDLSPES